MLRDFMYDVVRANNIFPHIDNVWVEYAVFVLPWITSANQYLLENHTVLWKRFPFVAYTRLFANCLDVEAGSATA